MPIRLSICLSLLLATAALADEPPAPGVVTARTLASSALLGFKLAIEDGAAGKPSEVKMLECVRALDETALLATFQKLLAADMTPAENMELDRFFASEQGK